MEEHRCQSEGQRCSSPHHRFILNFSSLLCHCIMTVLRPLCTSFYVKSRSFYCNWIHPSLSIPYNDIIVCRPAALQSYLDALILLWCTADPSASTADTLSSPHGVPERHEKAHIVVQVEALHLLGWLWHGRSLPCSAQLHCLQLMLAVAVSISFISGCLCDTWRPLWQPLWTQTPPTNMSPTLHSALMLLLLHWNTVKWWVNVHCGRGENKEMFLPTSVGFFSLLFGYISRSVATSLLNELTVPTSVQSEDTITIRISRP